VTTMAYNSVGRLTTVSNNAGTPTVLHSGVHYNAAGQVASETLGAGDVQTYTYDHRVRLTGKSSSYTSGGVTTPVYSFGLTLAPNGDVLTATDSANGNWNYSYDAFNRLVCSNLVSNGSCASPTSGAATYSYVYDRFGNRLQQNTSTGGPYHFSANFTGNGTNNNNRMDGFSYDAAGNLLNDGFHQYFYDAENHLIQVDGTLGTCTTATACYNYDAEGHRVHRSGYLNDTCDTTGKRDYVFDISGNWTAEVNSNGTACVGEVYAAGRRIARTGGASRFPHTDWLGTMRVENAYGFPISSLTTCTSLAFGDGQSCNSTVDVLRFTGKERDPESGLDNFGARYDSSSMGRFMSPDWSESPSTIPYASLPYPQSLNLYSYVENNPTTTSDPSGHACIFGVTVFGGWFGGKCPGDTPPSAGPPPPPPPAITPGTPQNDLANAQDTARSNPSFQPRGGKTFCNLATCDIVSNAGGPTGTLTDKNGNPNLANTDARTLAKSSEYHEVTPEEAQKLANQGVPVLAVQENPGRHGHIATVRPELMPGLGQSLGQAPMINNIGARRDIGTADQSFLRNQPVRYYAPNQ